MSNPIIRLSFFLCLFFSLNFVATAQRSLSKVTITKFNVDGDFGPAIFDADVKIKQHGQKGWSTHTWGAKSEGVLHSKFQIRIAIESDKSIEEIVTREFKKGSKIKSIKLENEGWEKSILLKNGVVQNLKTTGDINVIILQFECWPCK